MREKHAPDWREEEQETRRNKRRVKKQTPKMRMSGKGMKRFANPQKPQRND